METGRELILHIATSLDGFIASPDEDLGFLNVVEQQDEDSGCATFTASVDTVIMGRRTYDKVCTTCVPDPHPGRAL